MFQPPVLVAESDPSNSGTCHWHVKPIESGPVLNEIQFLDPQHGYGSEADCLWATADGGTHWKKAYCRPATSQEPNKIHGMQFFNSREGWLLVGTNTLLHTHDAGQSWSTQTFEKQVIHGFYFLDPENGWWVGEELLSGTPDVRGVIYATSDNGKTWVESRTQINVAYRWKQLRVWATSAADIWTVGDFILHSQDGGKTWEKAHISSTALARLRNVNIRFNGSNIGWILRSPPESYFVTRDGGRNWTSHQPPTKPPLIDDLLYLTADEAWLAAGRVYRSSDGGASWKESLGPGDRTHAEPRYYALHYLAAEHLLIATSDQGVASCTILLDVPSSR